ncbi:hypothetical protein RND71_009953 [Anisodus tanguticus]|uniref:Uncharacterized protein n=1 Tax=Anisodus tanguticus TaxID=243964 RepID=A0AAE1VHP7_9SOLA|nr:hypothetical protein RND71_009953 [Anisodus tanguticus]
MSDRANTRETVDSNEGGQEDQSGHGQDSNNGSNRGMVPPKRGSIKKRIYEDVRGSLSSLRTPPSTQAN